MAQRPGLGEIAGAWGRIGCLGFGGPPAHIALLREFCVERRGWIGAHEFEDAIAACNLLPGPASTQLAIFCAWRVGGWRGALVGGLGFVGPGFVAIVALAALFLAGSPPLWVRGAGLAALALTAFKVGALSYGGGFVIVPLMQGDAVHRFHWMTNAQFLGAVALGQVTPGPVVHTVSAVGYAAHGLGGAALAAAIAFLPSFAFVLLGARHFDRLRRSPAVLAFLDGAGPAAIGAIVGSAIPLALALTEPWQAAVLAAAAASLLLGRRGVVTTLVAAGAVGALLGLLGAGVPGG